MACTVEEAPGNSPHLDGESSVDWHDGKPRLVIELFEQACARNAALCVRVFSVWGLDRSLFLFTRYFVLACRPCDF